MTYSEECIQYRASAKKYNHVLLFLKKNKLSSMKAWRLPLSVVLVLIGLTIGVVIRDSAPTSEAVPSVAAVPSKPVALGQVSPSMLENERNTIDIVTRYEPGLVFISTEKAVVSQDPFGWLNDEESQVQTGVGSGFFVNDAGDILTNFHVVAGENGDIRDSKLSIRIMNDPRSYPAEIIGYAPQYDLALIRPTEKGMKIQPIPLGNSDQLKAGQKAIAMGAPFGLDFSVSEGIISSVARQIPIGFGVTGGITQKAIQTDAAINPGNSGGPLLNSQGEVVGINTQIFSPSGRTGAAQSAGIGFAIPINVAKNLLPRLQSAEGKMILAPRIGVEAGLVASTPRGALPMGLSALTAQARQEWHLPERGLLVGRVSEGGAAERAGIRGGNKTQSLRGGRIRLGGDVIIEAAGKTIDTIEDLQAVLIDKTIGDQLKVKVWRDSQTVPLTLTLDTAAFE